MNATIIFGSVAAVYEFETEEEAVQAANGTPYGSRPTYSRKTLPVHPAWPTRLTPA